MDQGSNRRLTPNVVSLPCTRRKPVTRKHLEKDSSQQTSASNDIKVIEKIARQIESRLSLRIHSITNTPKTCSSNSVSDLCRCTKIDGRFNHSLLFNSPVPSSLPQNHSHRSRVGLAFARPTAIKSLNTWGSGPRRNETTQGGLLIQRECEGSEAILAGGNATSS